MAHELTSSIHLQRPDQLLPISPILPTNFPALLALTSYLHIVDFAEIPIPFMRLPPEPEFWILARSNATATRWRDTFENMTGKNLRTFIFAICLGNRHLISDRDLRKMSFKYRNSIEHLFLIYKKPNPFDRFLYNFGPQYTVILSEQGSRASKTVRNVEVDYVSSGFLVHFYQGSYKSIIYLAEYSANAEHSLEIMPTVGIVCPGCEENALMLVCHEPKDVYTEFKFNCSGVLDGFCWQDMMQAESAVSQNGSKLFWSSPFAQPQWSVDSMFDTWIKQNRISQVGSPYSQLLFTLFLKPTEKNHQPVCKDFTLTMGDKFPHFSVATRSAQETDYVFVTESYVHTEQNALDLFSKAFDNWIWIVTFVAILATCFIWATLQYFQQLQQRSTWLFNVTEAGRFLLGFFLDQCPRDTPLVVTQTRSIARTRNRCIVLVWMVAILVLSNGYRGFLKARFAQRFPFQTSLENWRNFSGYSIFVFDSDINVHHSFRRADYLQSMNCPPLLRAHEDRKILFQGSVQKPIHEAHALAFDFYLSSIHAPLYNQYSRECSTENISIQQQCCNMSQEFETYRGVYRQLESVEPEQIIQLSGDKYKSRIARMNHLVEENGLRWNCTAYTLMQVDERHDYEKKWSDEFQQVTRNLTESTPREQFKWLIRKLDSAFVMHHSKFPWYWNIFKKAMVNDPNRKFAHTGPPELRQYSKAAAYERNDAPFYIYAKARPSPSGQWVLRRVAAIQETGIMNLWYKWNNILRPPYYERLNEEVSEESSDAKPLKIKDPAIEVLIKFMVALAVVDTVIAAMEHAVYILL